MSQVQFQDAISAFEKVKQTVEALKAEHTAVTAEIAAVNTELQALPLAYLPLEDLKAGILDFIDVSGERYAENHIRAAVVSFATGAMLGLGAIPGQMGKPLRYADLEQAMSGGNAIGRAQLLTPDKSAFDDQVLYFFISKLVREGLRKLMDGMTPAEFGYARIHADKIGSTRFERRVAIAGLEARLGELQARKTEIEQKLRAIGSPVPALVNGK